jgi:hypothetical protein
MIPYRDVFDNHSPLFQALCAPLFQLLGERADIIVPMRAGHDPTFRVQLVFGRQDHRLGILAASWPEGCRFHGGMAKILLRLDGVSASLA